MKDITTLSLCYLQEMGLGNANEEQQQKEKAKTAEQSHQRSNGDKWNLYNKIVGLQF